MSGLKPIYIMTCKTCGFNNPEGSSRCNKCAKELKPAFSVSDNYHARWGCPLCGSVNMTDNKKCHGCHYERPSNCFITTATLYHLDSENDKHPQLEILRKFRDEFVQIQKPELVKEYYEIAPLIVDKIETSEEKSEVFTLIYKNYIQTCLNLIEAGQNIDCMNKYIEMVEFLKAKYL